MTRLGNCELPTWSSFGARIRQLRHDRGWSQRMLADATGFHVQTISRLELGKDLPSADLLGMLAVAFGFEDMGAFMAGVKPGDLMR